MASTITDEQLRQLLRTTQPYTVALLRWGPEQHMDGVEAIRWEHSRRMASLRADGLMPIVCPFNPMQSNAEQQRGDPVGAETLVGVESSTSHRNKPARSWRATPASRLACSSTRFTYAAASLGTPYLRDRHRRPVGPATRNTFHGRLTSFVSETVPPITVAVIFSGKWRGSHGLSGTSARPESGSVTGHSKRGSGRYGRQGFG